MSVDMIAPQWMHTQVTAEEYESWSAEQRAGIEIVDGMVVVSPSASKRHNRFARVLANALDVAAGPDWNADTDPVVYSYLLDSASRRYRDGDVYTGLVEATVPFPVKVDLSTLA